MKLNAHRAAANASAEPARRAAQAPLRGALSAVAAGACACGGGCPRCRPALRAALGDGDEESAAPDAAASETPQATSPTQDAPAAKAPADPNGGAETLDDPACTAGKTDIKTSNKTVTAHGSTVQDAVEDATNKQGGHVASVQPKFDPYVFCPPASANQTVKAATVTVTEVKTVPTWAERGDYPKEAQDMWDRYVAVVDSHENDHIAIDTKAFTGMDQKAVGRKPADATAALDKITLSADAPNAALDKKEGCIKLNGGTGKVTKEPRANC